MTATNEILWSHCNECGHETKHDVLYIAERQRSYGDDHYPVDVGSQWKLLQCRGCEDVSLKRLDWCSEDDPYDGPNRPTYFPPRVSRRKPVWIDRLDAPGSYLELLDEIYTALHADSRRLAMMGVRALIDLVVVSEVEDLGNFKRGLDALVAKNLISERDRDVVDAAVNAGHASAHRGHKASSDDVNIVIDIVERLLQTELLTSQARVLRENTPERRRPTQEET